MRRILVAHFLPDIVSGAERAIADMTGKCSGAFQFIHLLPGDGTLAQFYTSIGRNVWVRRIQTPRRKYPGLHSVQSFRFAGRLRHARIDAVLANTFPAASRVGTACVYAGIPHGIYVREFVSDTTPHRRILERATAVFAVSRSVADHLRRMTDPSKISVAYDFVDVASLMERIGRPPRDWVVPPGTPVVGCVGRITRYKQQDLFVRAVPLVAAEIPEARFVVVGSATQRERPYEEEVKQLARELGVEDHIEFLGQRDDAVEIIAALDATCVTSDREPFPRTILEAQVMGTAVVAANSGGCPEMVEDGRTGLLFDSTGPHAAQALASSLVRVVREGALRERMVQSARQEVMEGYGSESPVRAFEALLAGLCKGGPLGHTR